MTVDKKVAGSNSAIKSKNIKRLCEHSIQDVSQKVRHRYEALANMGHRDRARLPRMAAPNGTLRIPNGTLRIKT